MVVKFSKVDNPLSLLPLVERRLPSSCFILNQLKFHEKIKNDLEIFSFGLEEEIWILTKYLREDWGIVISISAPKDLKVSKELKECFAFSGIIEWDKDFFFNALESPVTTLIIDINIEYHGRIVTLYPCHLFYMEPSEALSLQINAPENATVARLDVESGTPFIANNWKYSKGPKTLSLAHKTITHFPSGGLSIDQKLVAGAVTPAFGLVSMLHTDPDHRRKGYASHVMKFLFKELAREGLQPCLTSEVENQTAINFHKSLGMKPVGKVNFILSGH